MNRDVPDFAARGGDLKSQSFSRDETSKIAGFAGIGFVICVVAEGILRGQPLPHNSDVAQIVEYYVANGMKLSISSGLFILSLPLITIYASGLYRQLRTNPNGEFWGRVGWGAINALLVSFGLVVVADVTTLSLVNASPQNAEIIGALFKFHAAAFIMNAAVLGVILLGFAMAALNSSVVPRWLSILGIVGGALLILGSIPLVPVMNGSPWGFLGLGGFLSWLIWVLVTSIRLVRD